MQHVTRRLFLGFAAAVSIVRPAFARGAGVSTDAAGAAIQGYDTRAYWTVNMPREGADTFEVTWKDARWRFVTQMEADAFAADPARYAPRFGGFCTRAMSLKKVVDGDPEVWRIFEGALYLFARPVGRKVFDRGEAEMIAKAQAYWDSLG